MAPTEIVIADVPPPGAGIVVGLNLTVVPLGTPEAVKLIALLKVPITFVVIVELPWFPCTTDRDDGDALTVKSELFPIPWLIPRTEMGVKSPLAELLPTTTVRWVPAIVICLVTLLAGHDAADQTFAAPS